MADSTISNLTAGTVAASDDFAFVQSGTTKTDTIQGILNLASSDNLGTADLTSTANNRKFTLNGSTSSNKITFETGAGTDIFQIIGDNSFSVASGNSGFGVTPNSGATLYVSNAGRSNGLRLTGSGSRGIFCSGTQTNHIEINSSTANQKSIYALDSTTSGTARIIDIVSTTSSSGSKRGLEIEITNGATNYALNILAGDLKFDTTTGSKIGTATSEKIGFWNATPIVQPTTAYTAATFAANTSGISDDTATWDSYTIGAIVGALRGVGILA